MKKILVPTDFSKEATIATDLGFDIAKKSGADLVLFHVVEEGSTSSSSFNVEGQVAAGAGRGIDSLFMIKLIEKSKKQLQKAVSDPRYSSVKVEGVMRVGNPYHGMRTVISEQKADLVIMGTAGRSALGGMVIGSNTEKSSAPPTALYSRCRRNPQPTISRTSSSPHPCRPVRKCSSGF